MEPDNSQFTEVPSEEAAADSTEQKPKKPRKSKATPLPANAPEIKAETKPSGIPEEVNTGDMGWTEALGTQRSVGTVNRLVSAAKANKRKLLGDVSKSEKKRLNIEHLTEEAPVATGGPTASPEVEHSAGSHGTLIEGPATLDALSEMSDSHVRGMYVNSFECPTCATNRTNYETHILPQAHEAGEHDTPKGAVTGSNINLNCGGCLEDLAAKASAHSRHKHSKYSTRIRNVFAKNGCGQCAVDRGLQLADEHTQGAHSGGAENRREGCAACDEVKAKEDAALLVNPGMRAGAAAARIAKRGELRQIAVREGLVGGRLQPRRVMGHNEQEKTVYDRIPGSLYDPTIATEHLKLKGLDQPAAPGSKVAQGEPMTPEEIARMKQSVPPEKKFESILNSIKLWHSSNETVRSLGAMAADEVSRGGTRSSRLSEQDAKSYRESQLTNVTGVRGGDKPNASVSINQDIEDLGIPQTHAMALSHPEGHLVMPFIAAHPNIRRHGDIAAQLRSAGVRPGVVTQGPARITANVNASIEAAKDPIKRTEAFRMAQQKASANDFDFSGFNDEEWLKAQKVQSQSLREHRAGKSYNPPGQAIPAGHQPPMQRFNPSTAQWEIGGTPVGEIHGGVFFTSHEHSLYHPQNREDWEALHPGHLNEIEGCPVCEEKGPINKETL